MKLIKQTVFFGSVATLSALCIVLLMAAVIGGAALVAVGTAVALPLALVVVPFIDWDALLGETVEDKRKNNSISKEETVRAKSAMEQLKKDFG